MILGHWQEIATFIVVLIAAIAVGRRLFAHISAFRMGHSDEDLESEASACSGCDSCGPRRKSNAGSQLITLSAKAPQRVRLKRN